MRRLSSVAVCVVALALVSCASEDSAESDPTSSSTPQDTESPESPEITASSDTSETADQASVSAEPFCKDIDIESVEEALDAKGVVVTRALEPGQKYAQLPGAPKVPATTWSCELGLPTSKMPIGVDLSVTGTEMSPEGLADLVQGVEATAQMGTGGECTRRDEPAWGETAVVLSCTRPQISKPSSYQSGYTQVAYLGVVDDRGLTCSVRGDDRLDPDRAESAAVLICPAFLETVTS